MTRRPDLFPHLEFLTAEEAREARIKAFAILLCADNATLDDETDCWRCLFRHGVGPGEAMALTPEAIRTAREVSL